jgi:hypothetical protein
MKRLSSIAIGALGLALAGAMPSFAKADTRHGSDNRHVEHRNAGRHWSGGDRHDERIVHERVVEHIDRHYGPVVVERPVIVQPAPVYVTPADCDLSVGLGDVPACVLQTVRCEAPGFITSARLVRSGGFESYRFTVDTRSSRGNLAVSVDCGGHLLGIDRC